MGKGNNKHGWIYLVDGGNGLYKIGKTIQDPDKRVRDIQMMSPVDVELIYYFESDDLSRVERMLHRTLEKDRRHGEWFELSDEQVEIFKTIENCVLDDVNRFWGKWI